MRTRLFIASAICVAICLTDGPRLVAQQSSPTTLWNFLGIPQGAHKIRDAMSNRRGNHPGHERTPPLRSIADPANLESGVPAMEAAAKIKQAEDMKMQKIKAIKYLASIGCGCYDKDKTITDALLASLEDCTEEVRLATVEAIMTAAEGKACGNCHANCCCGKELVEKLSEIAYELDDSGCFIEPSERVRAAAVRALAVCCPSRQPLEIVEALPDDEDFSEEDMPELPEGRLQPSEDAFPSDPGVSAPIISRPSPHAAHQFAPHQFPGDHEARVMPSSSRRADPSGLSNRSTSAGSGAVIVSAPFQWVSEDRETARSDSQPTAPRTSSRRNGGNARPASYATTATSHGSPAVISAVRGAVEGIDSRRGLVAIRVRDNKTLPVGNPLQVVSQRAGGQNSAIRLEVIEARPGILLARPLESGRLAQIARGDEVIGW